MTLDSKSSSGSQRPPRMASSNRGAHTRPLAVMPRPPSNVYLSPIGFSTDSGPPLRSPHPLIGGSSNWRAHTPSQPFGTTVMPHSPPSNIGLSPVDPLTGFRSSAGSQHPSRGTPSRWNRGADSQLSIIAVMPHQPSDIDPFPVGSATAPFVVVPSLDDRTIVTTETWDRNNNTALPSLREQPEHVARPPAGQDTPSIAANVDRLPPVARLPLEILLYIFELCVFRGIELMPVTVPAQGPIYLAQVCKHWRAVVESDPRLWTSIQFYFPDTHQSREEDVARVESVFDLHLKRSSILPISLTVTDYRIYDSATEDLISLLVDRLRTHARRWKRISLHLSFGYFPLLFTFTPCDLSSLEHLYISGDVVAQRIGTRLRLDLESATSLKSFTYSGPGEPVDDAIHLRWESLAEVSLQFAPHFGTSSTLARHFRHLTQCQNITTCSLGLGRPIWPNGDQSVTLPCLQTLRVRRLSRNSHPSAAIDPLILPRLQTLEIDTSVIVGWTERWHIRAFSDLLFRSGCSLHRLSIQDVSFPLDELMRCLILSPELTSLRFIPYPRSQDIRSVVHMLDISHTLEGVQAQSQGRVAESLPRFIGGPVRMLNLSDVWAGVRDRIQEYRQGRMTKFLPRLREITLATSVEANLDVMMKMFRSRVGASAHATGIDPLRRVEVVFFDMLRDTHGDPIGVQPGTRLGRLASFRANLAQCVSENKCRNGDSLEALVVVDSSYLPEYINV